MSRVATALLSWYARNGRSELPWRTVRDPYYTVVSESMLAQTQVDRVVPKFIAFVARYPAIGSLASANLADVVRAWQGLGYNTRAIRLVELARAVVERFDGRIPDESEALRTLPGVGPYTAAAIRAFAFNHDEAALDTNIRRVLHRMHFGVEYPAKASTADLERIASHDIAAGTGHDWNSAMMDFGATICTARAPKCGACPLREFCAAAPLEADVLDALRKRYARRASPQDSVPFRTTSRYARGRIVDRLRELEPGRAVSLLDLCRDLSEVLPGRTVQDIHELVGALERDGLLARDGEAIALKD